MLVDRCNESQVNEFPHFELSGVRSGRRGRYGRSVDGG